MATVKSFSGERLVLGAQYRPGIGDSVAVNGACLTVTEVLPDGFAVELSHESQALLAVENYRGTVHIEPAMRLSDRLEGHILQGHVDGIGRVERIEKKSRSWDFWIAVEADLLRFMIPKGSVAVDGVSLTINEVGKEGFRLTIIPHSLENTLLQGYTAGRRVNVESDMFARYLWHMFNGKKEGGLSWETVDRFHALF